MENISLKYSGANRLEMIQGRIPKVIMDLEAYKKMLYMVKLSSKEIGWLGLVEKQQENVLKVKDVYLFRQQVGATTCEITPEGIEEVVIDLLQLENGEELIENLKLWGHSHVNMATSPSAQDVKQLNSFEQNGNEWFLGVIVNKSGDFNFTYIDYVTGIKVSNLSWVIDIPGFNDNCMELEIKNEIKEKVTDLPPIVVGNYNCYKKINTNENESTDLMDDIINRYSENDFNPYNSIAKEEEEEEVEESELWEIAVEHFEELWEYDKDTVLQELQIKLKDRNYKYTLKQLNKLLTPFSLADYANIGEDATHMSKDFKISINPEEIKQGIIEFAQDLDYVKPTEKFLNLAVQFTVDIKDIGSQEDIYDELVREFFQGIV